MAATARIFRQVAVRAAAATGATTLLASRCDGTKPPGTRELTAHKLNRLPTKTGEAPRLQRLASKDLPEQPLTPSEPAAASTRLHGLVETRDVEGLRSLLRDGHVNLAARNGDGLTALLVAARLREHEAAEIISLLTDAGASVDDIDRLGRGALHLAALAGNAATTRVLLQRGADPRRVDARRGATPAHYAAAFARVDAMAILCAHDAKAVRDARDRLGRSPLHWSALSAHRPWASQGSLRVADELLAAGASPRARDRTGATPAHAAARLGADAWLDQLAKRDTGLLDERDNRGVSPLDMLDARYRKSRVRSRFAFDLTGFDLPEVRLQIRLPRPFSRD